MKATCEEEHRRSLATNKFGQLAIFKGTNGWRLIIAAWPKIQQQFVGMNLFNTYATYFCKLFVHSTYAPD
jgi:SP family general alpha glucoside:H+ symporter-like MFS transporter